MLIRAKLLTNAWILKNVHPLNYGWIPESQAARNELDFLREGYFSKIKRAIKLILLTQSENKIGESYLNTGLR